jgi:hypothetical protein
MAFSASEARRAFHPPIRVEPIKTMPETQPAADTAPGTDTVFWVSDPDDPRFKRAMRHTCEICGAKPRRPCWNTIDSETPLPGRLIHLCRAEPKTPPKDTDD